MDTTAPVDPAAAPLRLAEELSIYTVGGLRAEWLAWLDAQRDAARIDAAAVGQVDAAGVQLLASLVRALEARAIGWHLFDVSGPLSDALRTLGLHAWTLPPTASNGS
jgi:anti-anti-sigma regulatory factor